MGMYVVFPVLAALLWALLSWQPILIFAYKWCTARGAPSEASFTPDVPMWHSPISAARVAVFRTSFTMMVAAFQIAAALFQVCPGRVPLSHLSVTQPTNRPPHSTACQPSKACLCSDTRLFSRAHRTTASNGLIPSQPSSRSAPSPTLCLTSSGFVP